jgi:hypothetical protein
MNTKALITTLAIFGSTSSLAVAHPATQYSASASVSGHVSWNPGAPARVRMVPATPLPAPTIRDHRYVAPAPIVVRPVAQRYGHDGDWSRSNGWGYEREPRATILAEGLTYNAGEYRKDIVLEGRGRFNTLMVNEEGGCTFIKEVRIEFIGGAVQSIPLNQTLTGNQSMMFDLDGYNRAINRIFVYRADGNHMNIGSRSSGEFSVTGL